MKKVVNGAVYDSEKCEIVAERNAYSNGNYTGADHLCLTASGKFFVYYSSNGCDANRYDGIKALDTLQDATQAINGWRLSDAEAQRLIDLGVLTNA